MKAFACALSALSLVPVLAAAAPATGQAVYESACKVCHEAGQANAPKLGDRARWKPLIKEGLRELTRDAIRGKGAMPPRGGRPELTDTEIARAVAYMANKAGANWPEPK